MHDQNHQSGLQEAQQQNAISEDVLARRFKRRSLIKGAVFLVTALGLLVLARATPLSHVMEPQWVEANIKSLGAWGLCVFTALAAVFTAVGAPRQIVSFLGGYAYGTVAGTALALLGTVLGCMMSFSFARVMGRGFIQGRIGARLRRLDDVLSHSPMSTTLMLRFLPFTNNLVTNLAAGVSNVGFGWYLLGSALGYVPQTLLFALLGSGIKVGRTWQVLLSIVLFVASMLLAWLLLRKHRRLYKVVQTEE